MTNLEKFFYVSVGLAADVSKRLESSLNKLIKEGKISEIDAKKILDDFKQSAAKYQKELSSKLEQMLKSTIDSLKVVKKSDLDQINKRLDQIEEKINNLIK